MAAGASVASFIELAGRVASNFSARRFRNGPRRDEQNFIRRGAREVYRDGSDGALQTCLILFPTPVSLP